MAEKKAIHINEAMQIMDIAREKKQTVNLKVWEGQSGEVIEYRGWMVSSSNWKGGWHRIINPMNNQIRTVSDIFIFEINGLSIFL
ncbi:maintenance system killer protein [Parabacteroides distasonis]